MSGKRKRTQPEVVGFLGVGLDNKDDHQRLTRSENFVIVGGSAETHERMQETAIKFDEALERTGKPLRETSIEQVIELFQRARE
ncbi:MAG: hypothetical protein K2R98_22745 [Gemmataceae bacterium]|nr:hypothetical protein [Gemmataceae bacterium]